MTDILLGVFTSPAVISILAITAVITCFLMIWRKVPQDKALVITGLKKRVISGAGGIQIPVLERGDYISLGNMQLDIITKDSLSSQGVPIKVISTAVFKVNNDKDSILAAMEQFSNKNVEQTEISIKKMVANVLEGKLREIVSRMTVEEINADRDKFGDQVQSVAGADLAKMGLNLSTFTIKDIDDENGYIKALGVKQLSEVKKNAEIAQAEADKSAKISVSQAVRDGEAARIKNETEIAEKRKEQEVQKSNYLKEQSTAKAIADAAYEIQKNITLKEVTSAEMDADLLKQQRTKEVEAAKVQILIAQEEKNKELAAVKAERQKEQLRADVIEPALAHKQEEMARADAEKYKKIAQAEAEAEVIKQTGSAQADVIVATAQAEAEAIRIKGLAEAEAMEKKADAYMKYNGAAMANMLIDVLPEIAGKIAEPLSKIEKIIVLDGGNGESGVSSVAGNVTGVMAKVMESMKEVTGIDLAEVAKAQTYDAKVTRNVNISGLNHVNTEVAPCIEEVVNVIGEDN